MPTARGAGDPAPPKDSRRLTYAGSFSERHKRFVVSGLEWVTGKPALLQRILKFRAAGVPTGQAFWTGALHHLGIDLQTPDEELSRIPSSGPLVVVSNHPHGMIDGMVLAELIGRVRTDYKILARSLVSGVPQIADFTIPVPFPHDPQAHRLNLDARRRAMAHLASGGTVVVFPAGEIAAARSWQGAAVEADWTPFTAAMIRRSGAAVLPIHLPGQNGRLYQAATRLSPVMRQGLLLHEVVRMMDRPLRPHIGHVVDPAELRDREGDPRALSSWLREATLALGD